MNDKIFATCQITGNKIPVNKDSVIFFCGIGGIGMSGIAKLLFKMGYVNICGSDSSDGGNVESLRKMGIHVCVGHHEENITKCKLGTVDIMVKTTSIRDSNPENEAMKRQCVDLQNCAIIHRSDAVNIAANGKKVALITGCHGKTTVTAMVANMFKNVGVPANVLVGGIMQNVGENYDFCEGAEWLVLEGDESDGSFLKTKYNIGVVTNIDADHLDYYGDFDDVMKAFETFAFNGVDDDAKLILCNCKNIKQLYSTISGPDYIGINGKKMASKITLTDSESHNVIFNSESNEIKVFNSPTVDASQAKTIIFAKHTMANIVATCCVAKALLPKDEDVGLKLAKAIVSFEGVDRRFSIIGRNLFADVVNGKVAATDKDVVDKDAAREEADSSIVPVSDGVVGDKSLFVDDYAHHPVEIAATIESAKKVDLVDKFGKRGRIVAVFQPHRYTRTRDLMVEFGDALSFADKVFVTEIYEASEDTIEGVTPEALCAKIAKKCDAEVCSSLPYALADIVKNNIKDGDIWLFLGAGNISVRCREALNFKA